MGLIKEPKHIDFSTKSEPWTFGFILFIFHYNSKSLNGDLIF
jgi:hypothetical protein